MSEPRPLLVTIDGDGFIYRHRESGHPVGELIRDRILRAYPFEFTAAFIAREANLNGGDPLLPFSLVGGRHHCHSRAWNDWAGMDLRRRVARAGGGVEAYLRSAPERLDGFFRVIEFFEAHPRLPVHVYFIGTAGRVTILSTHSSGCSTGA